MTHDLNRKECQTIRNLVEDLLDNNDKTCPVPNDEADLSNAPVTSRGISHVDVAAERLTQPQKLELQRHLELLAGLCLQRAMKLTGAKVEDVIQRAEWFLRRETWGLNEDPK